jgi:5'-deoxynucleotidase YfbR-like HD superfamily hydrolase
MLAKINQIRRMKNVNRLGTERITRPYNLLEHSFMVTILFRYFAEVENVFYDEYDIDLIMHHDLLETVTGDLPYNVKNLNIETEKCWAIIERDVAKGNPVLEKYTDQRIGEILNARQYQLFKACDLLDLWIFICEEFQLGNLDKNLAQISERCVSLIGDTFPSINQFMKEYDAALFS